MSRIDELLAWAETERGNEPLERFLARLCIRLGVGVSHGYMRLPPTGPTLPPKTPHEVIDG